MIKPVILVCVAFLVAGLVGVGGLYFTDDIDVAIGGFVAAALLQVIVMWNWKDTELGRPQRLSAMASHAAARPGMVPPVAP